MIPSGLYPVPLLTSASASPGNGRTPHHQGDGSGMAHLVSAEVQKRTKQLARLEQKIIALLVKGNAHARRRWISTPSCSGGYTAPFSPFHSSVVTNAALWKHLVFHAAIIRQTKLKPYFGTNESIARFPAQHEFWENTAGNCLNGKDTYGL